MLSFKRAKKLLKKCRYAGIILPFSFLINENFYKQSREYYLRIFLWRELWNLVLTVFVKTGKNTICLFLEKIDESSFVIIEDIVNKFLKH